MGGRREARKRKNDIRFSAVRTTTAIIKHLTHGEILRRHGAGGGGGGGGGRGEGGRDSNEEKKTHQPPQKQQQTNNNALARNI